MKRFIIQAIAVVGALTFLVGCSSEPTFDKTEPEAPFVEGEVLVKFSPEVAEALSASVASRSGAVTRSGAVSVDRVMELVEVFEIEPVFPEMTTQREVKHDVGLDRWYVVRFGGDYTAEEVAEMLTPLGDVQKIDFNRTIKRAYTGKATPLSLEKMNKMGAATRAGSETDPLLSAQWHLINRGDQFVKGESVKSVVDADVQVEKAWERTMGNSDVIVAVLDEGVFVNHPDLKDNIWVNPNEVRGSMEDNDGNGYAGDYYGYNFARQTGAITWNDAYDSGHGSHVAGVIAAMNNNGLGIGSIAGGTPDRPGVKIMVCQLFSGSMGATGIHVARAIKYAADNGAVVLQCSWGYVSGRANIYDWGEAGFDSQEAWEAGAPLEKDALDYFVHNAGSPNGPIEGGVAVFAGGNESAPMAGYPGASDDYISVAATAADFTPAVYTNYGPGTSVSAPGGDQDYYWDYVDEEHNYGEVGCVLSTLPYHVSPSGYGYMEGTSMACPHVSGVVALGISYAADLRKHFKAEEIRDMVINTAVPIDDYVKGKKFYTRYVADIGPQQPMNMNLDDYKGKMGSGQVSAEALLAAIQQGGVAMRFPNLYIPTEGSVAVIPARYFVGGEELTYIVNIADTSVASVAKSGDKLVFSGLAAGVTTASITASNGETHNFTITVRGLAGESGWL